MTEIRGPGRQGAASSGNDWGGSVKARDNDGNLRDLAVEVGGRAAEARDNAMAASHPDATNPAEAVPLTESARGHRESAAAAFDRALAIDDLAAARRDRALSGQQRHRDEDDPNLAAGLIQSRQERAPQVYEDD